MKVIFEMSVGIVLTRKTGSLAKNRVRICAPELMLAFPQHCIVSREAGSTVFSWELTPSDPARFHSRQMILRVKSGPNEQRGWEGNQSEPGGDEQLGKAKRGGRERGSKGANQGNSQISKHSSPGDGIKIRSHYVAYNTSPAK